MPALDKYIENKDFVTWVLGDQTLDEYWEEYLKNNPNERQTIDEAKQLVLQAKVKDPYFSAQRESELWQNIEKNITTIKKETKVVSMDTKQWWKYGAAVIVLGLIFVFYYRNFVPQHHTEVAHKGFTNNVTLPDGSTVNLNAESTISYDQESFTAGRYISLKGEAFFSVKKGKQFQVTTELGKVTVLGTSFNIFARDKKWVVSCFSGKVKVEDQNGKDIILTKGEEAIYKNGEFIAKTHYGDVPSWQKGLFNYSNIPLEDVFEELQRQFDVRFIYKNSEIQDLRFTGTVSNKSLETTLNIIAKSMGINYKINKEKKEVEISL